MIRREKITCAFFVIFNFKAVMDEKMEYFLGGPKLQLDSVSFEVCFHVHPRAMHQFMEISHFEDDLEFHILLKMRFQRCEEILQQLQTQFSGREIAQKVLEHKFPQ